MRTRCIIVILLGFVLASCGNDSAAAPSEAADTLVVSDAAQLQDLPTIAEIPSPQDAAAVQEIAVAAEVEASIDAGSATDAGPAFPPWLIGTWKDCNGQVTIDGSGNFTWMGVDSCTFGGNIVLTNDKFTFNANGTPNCKVPNWVKPDVGAAVQGDILSFVHQEMFGGIHRLAKGNVTRERWLLTDQNNWDSNLSLCFAENGAFYDGGFMAVKECGFLACGGRIDNVEKAPKETRMWTHCSGDCPCTGIVIASVKTATEMSGKFASASCVGGISGTFKAKRVTFPSDPPP